jgi:hypothetical protein
MTLPANTESLTILGISNNPIMYTGRQRGGVQGVGNQPAVIQTINQPFLYYIIPYLKATPVAELSETSETAEKEVQDTSCRGSGGVPQL